ncbi:MAG: hypothetical protein LPK26_04680 [Bacillaceae bacterium]|nr:hypothetical protein [Bacillaceae bacterium]
MKKTKNVVFNGEQVEIKKMPLGKFSKLLLALDGLPSKLYDIFTQEELESFDNMMLLKKAPLLVATAESDILELVSIASDIEKEKFIEGEPEEFLDVVAAILELNNVKAIIDKVKNLKKVLQNK